MAKFLADAAVSGEKLNFVLIDVNYRLSKISSEMFHDGENEMIRVGNKVLTHEFEGVL